MQRILKVFCTGADQDRLAETLQVVARYEGFIIVEIAKKKMADLTRRYPVEDINMAEKYLTSWRNYDIGSAWKKLMHENSALMHNSNFVIKSFDFESRVESIARSVQLLVLAVPSAAHGGPFTKTEAKKAFKLSSEAARLEAAAP